MRSDHARGILDHHLSCDGAAKITGGVDHKPADRV
jgi:hypothetical protein